MAVGILLRLLSEVLKTKYTLLIILYCILSSMYSTMIDVACAMST